MKTQTQTAKTTNHMAHLLFSAVVGLTALVACTDSDDDTSLDAGGTGDAGPSDGGALADGGECSDLTLSKPSACVEGEALTIIGEYSDNFGSSFVVEACRVSGKVVSSYSNAEQYVVVKNPCTDEFYPGKWSRYDWTWYEDDLYYCTTVFDADTEAEAITADAPDASDPASGGCSDFEWSKLTPAGANDGGSDAALEPSDATADAGDAALGDAAIDAAADASDAQ